MKNLQKLVFSVISETLKINIKLIKPSTSAKDIDNWDSLTNVRLILALEKKFKIKISFGETIDIDNVGDLVNLIKHKL